MFGSGVIDTAIGLVFVFLLVSMLVTVVNEMISAALLSRAKWLRIGIDRLLGSQWAQQLYDHPLISGTALDASPMFGMRGVGPSYIASRSFANVLLDLVHRQDATVSQAMQRLQAALDGATTAAELPARLQIDISADVAVAGAIKRDLGRVVESLGAGVSVGDAKSAVQRFIDAMPARYLRQVLERFPDQKVGNALLLLLDDAEHDVEKFKENIEIWFNNAMDRVSGWYKRRSQWVIAILSLAAAVFVNVDAVLVVKYLDTHPGVRDALVTQAKAYADSNPAAARPSAPASAASGAGPSLVATSGERFVGVLPFARAASEPGQVALSGSSDAVVLRETAAAVAKGASGVEFAFDSKPATTASTVTIKASGAATGAVAVRIDPSLVAKLDDVQDRLLQLNLPIGWVREAPAGDGKPPQGAIRKAPSQSERDNMQVLPASWRSAADLLTFHFLGWILTALAASLGAPFWFDTLNRIISIRSAGKAPEEAPKPPKNVPVPLEPGQSPREADLSAGGRR